MRTVQLTITPEMASQMLKNATVNRKANQSRINYYAQQMMNGKWILSPQGISFNTKGQLMDGQHRLMAVVKSGVSVDMNVTYDTPDECMMVFDTGMNRTTPQILKLLGYDPFYYDVRVAGVINGLRRLHGKNTVNDADDYIKIFEAHRDTLQLMRKENMFVASPNLLALPAIIAFCAIENGNTLSAIAFAKAYRLNEITPSTNIKHVINLRDGIKSKKIPRQICTDTFREAEKYFHAFYKNFATVHPVPVKEQMSIPELY